MKHVIVGHPSPDPDCAVGMYALATGLVARGVPKKDISFHVLSRESTWGGIVVHSDRIFEEHAGVRVYHVDCGGSALDHHPEGCTALSATALVHLHFSLGREWQPLVAQVNADDQGKRQEGSVITLLAKVLRGMWRDNKPLSTALAFTREVVEAELANERARLAVSAVTLQECLGLGELPPLAGEVPLLASVPVQGFGRVGVLYSPDAELWGPLNYRAFHPKYLCRVVVAYASDTGCAAVWVRGGRCRDRSA